ncbi:MAG: glycosyltransferase family 2 protein [Culicoidibacterales bacterium]
MINLSIIVPVYNVEAYVGRCLDSLLEQDFEDFEIIVVNDGSTDSSGKICDEYAKKDQRIRVIHQENQGVSAARNTGLNWIKGEYIGFIDPDDFIEKDMFKKLYTLCIENNAQIGVCNFQREIKGRRITNNSQKYEKKLTTKEALEELFKGELYRFSLCNKIFQRHLFMNITFPEGRIHEDLATTYRLFGKAKNTIYTNYAGYIYTVRENSILNKKYNENRLESFIAWNEILEYMNEQFRELMPQVVASYSYWCIDNLAYIVKQVETESQQKKYFGIIRTNVKKHYQKIFSNQLLTTKQKIIILIVLIQPMKIKMLIGRK